VTKKSNSLIHTNYFLEAGYLFLATKSTVISTVLGSSVSVCIYDRKRNVGGINHFQFPFIGESNQATAKYGNVATIALIRMMVNNGSKIKHLEAQILGGAYNRKVSPKNIGLENIMTARKILIREMISIASEDVGGEKGRKIVFNTNTSEIAVIKVEKLRNKDWYPYEDHR
jgi:chemotaxis protein CheD